LKKTVKGKIKTRFKKKKKKKEKERRRKEWRRSRRRRENCRGHPHPKKRKGFPIVRQEKRKKRGEKIGMEKHAVKRGGGTSQKTHGKAREFLKRLFCIVLPGPKRRGGGRGGEGRGLMS